MQFHSKELYTPHPPIWTDAQLSELISDFKKSKKEIPPYIIIQSRYIRDKNDVKYSITYYVIYDTKDGEFLLYSTYDYNPHEFNRLPAYTNLGKRVETLSEAVDALHETMQADYADSKLRKKKSTKPAKRKPKKVVKKCKCN